MVRWEIDRVLTPCLAGDSDHPGFTPGACLCLGLCINRLRAPWHDRSGMSNSISLDRDITRDCYNKYGVKVQFAEVCCKRRGHDLASIG